MIDGILCYHDQTVMRRRIDDADARSHLLWVRRCQNLTPANAFGEEATITC